MKRWVKFILAMIRSQGAAVCNHRIKWAVTNRPSLRLSVIRSRQSILQPISMYVWRKRATADWLTAEAKNYRADSAAPSQS